MERIPHPKQVERRLNWVNGMANVCGAALTIFFASQLQATGETTGEVARPIYLFIAGGVVAGLLWLGNTIGDQTYAEMWRWYVTYHELGTAGEAPAAVRRSALNMTLISTLVTLAMWFLAGLIFAGVGLAVEPQAERAWQSGLQVASGTWISGLITATLIYFSIEWIWRPVLPIFFQGQDLTREPGHRLPVRSRMMVLFAASMLPLFYLAFLTYSQAQQIAAATQPATLLPRLLMLEVSIAGSSLLAAVILARSLASALVRPLENLSESVKQVGEGNLATRVTVESNDEIGVLAANFNRTIENLERSEMELRVLYEISQDLNTSLEIEEMLQTLARRVSGLVGCQVAEVWLKDGGTGRLERRTGQGEPGEIIARAGEDLAKQVEHELRYSTIAGLPGAIRSGLGMPLIAGQELVGMLALFSREVEVDLHTQRLVETLAPQAGQAIQNVLMVVERERILKSQIEALQIELDRQQTEQQVAEITESEFFQGLQKRANTLRKRRK